MPLPAASTPIRRGTVVRNRTMARLSQPGTNSGGPPSRASAWRATSAGGIRPASWCLSMPWSVGASVSVAPGARTSTSTPWLRSSAHRASPSVITKAFVAAYAADHGKPMNPSIEPVSSSPPRPRAISRGAKARARSIGTWQLTFSMPVRRAPSSVWCSPLRPKPALLTTRPTSLSAHARTSGSMKSGRSRSRATTSTRTPCAARSSLASWSSRSARRAVTTTSSPCAASSRANAAPMPDDAPVTRAHGPNRFRKSISASRRDAFEQQLAEQRLVHLLRRGGPRQRRQEADVPRLLVAGELLAHVRDQLLGGERGAIAQYHRGRDRLAPVGVGHADDAGLADRRVRQQDPLDLGWEDALAAAADHLLAAADDRPEALGVDHAEVAGQHPAVADRARALLRIPP